MNARAVGHVFVDEAELVRLARSAIDPVPGSPAKWELNQYGQPIWLLTQPWAQLTGAWGVIVPPSFDVDIPPEIGAARERDRRHLGLGDYGEGDRKVPELLPVLA